MEHKEHDNDNVNDLGLGELRSTWQSQPADKPLDFSVARAQQRKRKLWFYLDLVQACVLFLAGLFFLSLPASLATLIAGPIMLLSAGIMLYYAFNIHRKVIDYTDWSTDGLLQFRRLSYAASIKHLRLNQLGCVISLSFTAVLVILKLLLPASVPSDLMIAFLILSPFLCLLFLYLQKRVRHYQKLGAQVAQLKREFDNA
ncbi:hypothetical protein QWY82_11225 [Simiduia curdlanivorans]|uniref:RDD family protein n=1 Tax=Simiduia curdlanivorans TaxID=1492769 RepID=A0ABV8V8R5_9GAMM|nr:hypothetical protein [Simiduia curdlanivorans]MDN3639376.1 hypothetical protein [Simiduia curdlanivorans]